MIIGISGKMGHGKDALGLAIQTLMDKDLMNRERLEIMEGRLAFPPNYYPNGWEIRKFAHRVKEVAALLLQVPVELFEDRAFKESTLNSRWNYIDNNGFKKQMTVRQFLQRLGTDAMRNGLHEHVWVNSLIQEYLESPDSNPNWIITDVRFPNEAKAVLEYGGILIRLNRINHEGVPFGYNNPNAKHPSETGLDDWTEWNYVINNSGTLADLLDAAKEIVIKEKLL